MSLFDKRESDGASPIRSLDLDRATADMVEKMAKSQCSICTPNQQTITVRCNSTFCSTDCVNVAMCPKHLEKLKKLLE